MRTKNRILASLVIGAVLAGSGSAYAQGHPGGHGGPGHNAGPARHGPGPQAHRPGPGPRHAGPGPRVYRPDPPYHRWGRGDAVPYPYRGPQYVVNDWRGHRLSAPPRGYHWVNVGADYFLIGVATGVVLQSILN